MPVSDTEVEGDQAFRLDNIRDRGLDNTYSGALSFLRRKFTRDLTGADVAVVGVPFDLATTYRPGARLGPRAVRAGSVQLAELKQFPFGFNLFEKLGIVDWGDIYFDGGHADAIPDIITRDIAGILAQDVKTLSLGGDHFVTYPILRAYAEKFGPMSIVHFDAHCDTWPDDGTRLDHGSMFARAAKEGIIDPKRSAQIGLRTWNDEDYGFTVMDAPYVHANSIETVIERTLDAVGEAPAYMTFDIDCLDPAFAPGTGTPVAGGLSSAQALAIIRGLGALNWKGADVVEVAPSYDHAEITAIAAATIAQDWLCLLAAKQDG